MDDTKPVISVVLAVHNGEKFITETLNSITKQSFRDWECIIIEDFSTDSTPEILRQFSEQDSRIKVYPNEENLKLPKSLNRGLALASGKYIARMDADDICLPNRFERQVSFMEAHSELSVSFCKFFTLREDTASIAVCGRRCDQDAIAAMFLLFDPVLHPGVIARADAIKRYGYRAEYTCTEDVDIWERMLMGGEKIACQNEYLMLYRLHATQISATTNEKQQQEIMRLQKVFYRELLFDPTEEELKSYITHVYFLREIDLNGLYCFYKKVLAYNRKKKFFSSARIVTAFAEILAECNRKASLSFGEKLSMLRFGGIYFVTELMGRKKRAKKDIQNAAETAGRFGLTEKGYTGALPQFTYQGGEQENGH